jgi:hypothetical protein
LARASFEGGTCFRRQVGAILIRAPDIHGHFQLWRFREVDRERVEK